MESRIVLTKENIHEKSNFIARTFLTWSFGLFRRGYKTAITVDDLWIAREKDRSSRLGDRLEEGWEQEKQKAKEDKRKPSLTKAILRSFWVEYMLCGVQTAILFIVLWPLIPYVLGLFINYFTGDKTPETYRNAHIYNFVMNALSISTAVWLNHLSLSQGLVGMRIRVASCSVLYRKILKLNTTGLHKTEAGQVINLMSNDVNRFDMVVLYLHFIWVMPIVVPVVSYLVWQKISWATLAALGVIIVQTILVQVYLSKRQGTLRGKIAKRTDERVKVMSELVSGVQVIKMYAWEKPFGKLVDTLRKMEVKFIFKTSMIKGFSMALTVYTERLILFAGVVGFVVLGGEIRAEITFSLVQYFNLLQLACNIFFPMALAFLAEAMVSVRRIEEFLLLEELGSQKLETKANYNNGNVVINNVEKEKEMDSEKPKPTSLVLSNVNASWKDNSIVDTLRNIDFTASPGEFIGVAGLVGAGKSTLLQLLLGEIKPTSGTVNLGGARISYASQEPWLFVGTVKQNILFGLPYDKIRYKKVVTACALVRDFDQLPAGDATLVGERGLSLSGGQRARIGLARACYRQADIYLLDDPLSAVDTHVGKHLTSECVMGFLRFSTRILVTHQLHHLKQADKLLILRNGEIEAQGTFDEVSKLPLFEELLDEEEHPEEADQILRQRSMSIQSEATSSIHEGGNLEENEDPQETEELMEKGKVSASVYSRYFRAGGGWLLLSATVAGIILAQVVTSVSDLWLTYWMNHVEKNYATNTTLSPSTLPSNVTVSSTNLTESSTNLTGSSTNLTDSSTNLTASSTNLTESSTAYPYSTMLDVSEHDYYIYVWFAALVGCMVLTTGRSMMFLWVCMRSSINMHNQMFKNILAATMRFFDTNPSGRILNRFSKDMGIVDEVMPRMFMDSIQVFMVMVGILVMVAIVAPYMLITTFVCGVLMIIWTMLYLDTAQAIKRVEGVTRSPVFSHVSASMLGLSTIRANNAQHMLVKQFDDKQDVHSAAWYLTLSSNTAFQIWLSMISGTYVIVVAYTFLLLDDGTTKSGNVGLALSQSLILVNMVQYGVKAATEVISQMTSVERLLQFTSLPKEVTDGPLPPSEWPQRARVVFKNLYLRYDAEAEPVLRDLNLIIESAWKVGVVGRTGAGKSSLISALFRLAPLDGHVYIDDIETGTISLKSLRSKIAIIPQEPVLFSASLRYNMDPFDKYTDAEIWSALEQVELKDSVPSLSTSVTSGGTNFSAGQRQLLCLARAALARNKLLVLDEATANVDPNTDALIQKSIRKYFSDCTVITVAHRLHTVADSDRVVVMEAGRIVECGHPHSLLQTDGHFSQMVQQLGAAAEQSLREQAARAHAAHIKYADADNEPLDV